MKKYGFLRFTDNSLLFLFTFNIGFYIVYGSGDNCELQLLHLNERRSSKISGGPLIYIYIYI